MELNCTKGKIVNIHCNQSYFIVESKVNTDVCYRDFLSSHRLFGKLSLSVGWNRESPLLGEFQCIDTIRESTCIL